MYTGHFFMWFSGFGNNLLSVTMYTLAILGSYYIIENIKCANTFRTVQFIFRPENPRLETQKRMNVFAQEMLTIQKQKNDELEREIMLIEKRNQMLAI